MELQNDRGYLKHWNDDKGFGFIKPEHGAGEVFIHISALKKVCRRPIIGDIIYFQVQTDNEGKKRAVNAKIDGVSSIQPRIRQKNVKIDHKNPWFALFFILVGLAVIGLFLVEKNDEKSISTANTNPLMVPSNPINTAAKKVKYKEKYACNGKTYCSQMTSCAEAKFYLRNCTGAKVDGDGDGLPCESQWRDW